MPTATDWTKSTPPATDWTQVSSPASTPWATVAPATTDWRNREGDAQGDTWDRANDTWDSASDTWDYIFSGNSFNDPANTDWSKATAPTTNWEKVIN